MKTKERPENGPSQKEGKKSGKKRGNNEPSKPVKVTKKKK